MYELPQRFQVTDLHVAYFNLSFGLWFLGEKQVRQDSETKGNEKGRMSGFNCY